MLHSTLSVLAGSAAVGAAPLNVAFLKAGLGAAYIGNSSCGLLGLVTGVVPGLVTSYINIWASAPLSAFITRTCRRLTPTTPGVHFRKQDWGLRIIWAVFQRFGPTGWLPTTFDPCTGIGNQTLAVYQKPPSRGRIHPMLSHPGCQLGISPDRRQLDLPTMINNKL